MYVGIWANEDAIYSDEENWEEGIGRIGEMIRSALDMLSLTLKWKCRKVVG